MNINKALDKAYEKEFANRSMNELADAPVDALQGVSKGDAELLQKAFGIKTIRDMANCKYFRWAQAITNLSDAN